MAGEYFRVRVGGALVIALLLLSSRAARADWEQAVAAYQAGNYQAAVDEVQTFVEQAPDKWQGHWLLGSALLKLGRNSEGLNSLRQAYDLDPNQLQVQFDLAQGYLANGRTADAAALLQQVDSSSLPANARSAYNQLLAKALADSGLGGTPETEFRESEPRAWTVQCTEDEVTTVRTCRARTSGHPYSSSNAEGRPGSVDTQTELPFEVVFVNGIGPIFAVGTHDHPGKKPVIRVDDHEPITIQYDVGVTETKSQPEVVEELLSGEFMKARYYEWPEGYGKTMIVDIRRFADAWQHLQEKLREED